MEELEKALRVVEAAGFTVIDDRRLRAYYLQHEPRYTKLLNRATGGDWIAAEELLHLVLGRPDGVRYSPALAKFTAHIMNALLSRRAITSATKPSRRMKNPLLAAVLKTDGRKDYQRDELSRELARRFDAHRENDTKVELVALLEAEGIPVDTQNKLLSNAKKIG